jgi:hypothetical protein
MTTISPAEYRERVFAWARDQGLTQIRLVIHQPKVAGTTEWTCSLDDLRDFAELLEINAGRTVDAEKAYNTIPLAIWSQKYLNPKPNDEECAFCRAMPTCPSVQGNLQKASECDFDVVADDEMAPDPALLPPVKLATAMKIVPLMEAWCKAVRAETERNLMAGREIPGYGLGLGRQGNRKWTDEEAIEHYLRKTMRLKIEDVYSFKLRSPTQIEKLTKGKDPVIGPVQWAKLSERVVRDDPKPSVMPESQIKTRWVPPLLSDEGFTATPGDDSLD